MIDKNDIAYEPEQKEPVADVIWDDEARRMDLLETGLRKRRTYKDTIFRMLFKENKNLLSLYNALSDTNYTDVEDFTIVTLENAIYMSMENDLAFVVDFQIYLYEHQSTYNPNMPLRNLIYIGTEYKSMIDETKLYSSRMLKIPTPHFMVFYNGEATRPEYEEFKLSDMFVKPVQEPDLELKVRVININAGNNRKLMEACDTLREYSLFVEKVRLYKKECGSLTEAVEWAIKESIQEGILSEFLKKNRGEVMQMCLFEYDEEAVREMFKQEAYEDGHAEGLAEGEQNKLINQVAKKLAKGKTPEEIADDLEEDIEVIRNILKELDN